MTALVINGYLQKEVVDNKHRSARVASNFIRTEIKKAGGKPPKIEVLMGMIFLTLKDDVGVKELSNTLTKIDGVKVEEPSEAMLIFMKERARITAMNLQQKAA